MSRRSGIAVSMAALLIKERWDEREACRGAGGDVMHRLTSYHEFFRHGDVREFRCSGFSYPAGNAPGTSWTVHVHASSRVTGDQQGTSERDVWGSSASGLVVRERARVDTDSTQPVFGRTHYHEQYEIKLESLDPQR